MRRMPDSEQVPKHTSIMRQGPHQLALKSSTTSCRSPVSELRIDLNLALAVTSDVGGICRLDSARAAVSLARAKAAYISRPYHTAAGKISNLTCFAQDVVQLALAAVQVDDIAGCIEGRRRWLRTARRCRRCRLDALRLLPCLQIRLLLLEGLRLALQSHHSILQLCDQHLSALSTSCPGALSIMLFLAQWEQRCEQQWVAPQ